MIPKTGGKPIALTRTTTFIDAVDDKSNLMDWKQRGVLVGAARLPELLERVRAIDPDWTRSRDKADSRFKAQMADIAEEAMGAGGFNDSRDKGTHLHGLSELVDRGEALPDDLDFDDFADMMAYRVGTAPFFTWTQIEQFTVCAELGTGGTPDRVGTTTLKPPRGRLSKKQIIGDLKTGTTEYGQLKMAMQLAIYAHSEVYDPLVIPAPPRFESEDDRIKGKDSKGWKEWKSTEHDPELAASAYSPIPDIDMRWGMIMNLPAGSGQLELFWADLVLGWKAAKLATTIRNTRRAGTKALTAIPAAA